MDDSKALTKRAIDVTGELLKSDARMRRAAQLRDAKPRGEGQARVGGLQQASEEVFHDRQLEIYRLMDPES